MNTLIKSCLFLLLVFAITTPTIAKQNPWQRATVNALNFIEQTLRENHPAWIGDIVKSDLAWDREPYGDWDCGPELLKLATTYARWNSRLEQAKLWIQPKIELVNSQDAYQQLLSLFTRKLGEHQTSVSFENTPTKTEATSWPGYLITYLPHIKRFSLLKEEDYRNSQRGCLHHYTEVTHIDNDEIKSWLKKNVIPLHHAGYLDDAAYKACAPYALVTRPSPFTKKPQSIQVTETTLPIKGSLRSYSAESIPLAHRAISHNDLENRITAAQKRQSEFGWTVSKNAFFTMFNNRAYVYLPTFDPKTRAEEAALKAVIEQLPTARACNEIVFDLRTNTGGKGRYARDILIAWAGESTLYRFTPGKRIDWRVSRGNIRHLKSTRLNHLASKLSSALREGKKLFKEEEIKRITKQYIPPRTDCKVKIIIDGYNQGAACKFISDVQGCAYRFGPVTLVGQATSSKGNFEDVRKETFGKGSTAFTLHFPISLNKTYDLNNDRYTPDESWENEGNYSLCQFPKDNDGLTRLLWPEIEKEEEPTAELPSWPERAKADITSIEKVLQENHPGAVYEESNYIKQWITDSKEKLAEMLPLVTDEASYKALLSWYVSGFQDGLTSIKFPLPRRGPEANRLDRHAFRKTPQTFEWPGILISYDPASKSFLPTPNGYDLTGCLYWRGYRVIKIDDLDTRTWIEKNIVPFESEARSEKESTYVKFAPWALVYKNNPFAKKPKTITIQGEPPLNLATTGEDRKIVRPRPQTETLTLNWRPIEKQELVTRIKSLKTPTPDKNAHILFFEKSEASSHPYDAYVKIPSFDVENGEIARSLDHVAEKLNQRIRALGGFDVEKWNREKSTVNIVFDLRGNAGGSQLAVTKMINNLRDERAQEWLRVRSWYEAWWRATPTNISQLCKTPHELLSPRSQTKISELITSMKSSLAAGEDFFKEQMPRVHTLEALMPLAAITVLIIVDADCSGSTFDFIDRVRRLDLGNFTLLGQPTSAYSMYMHACQTKISSAVNGNIALTYPIAIRKNLSKQHNQPWIPDHILSDGLMHPRPLEETNAFLTDIAGHLPSPTPPTEAES